MKRPGGTSLAILAVLLTAVAFTSMAAGEQALAPPRPEKYRTVKLTADLSVLTDRDRRMIPLLLEAADAMDEAFWIQAYGDRKALFARIGSSAARRFAEINYGPWDRLANNEPFVEGVGPKPLGANFYPADMTKEEFERAAEESRSRGEALRSLYTMVRRTPDGALQAIPYREFFEPQVRLAASRLREAAGLAEAPGLRRYLELRAEALVTDRYQPSDLAWLDMKDNAIEVVIGPIETYEDGLFGYKAAFEAFVLIKDREWSERLTRYAALLPDLQRTLPVPDAYKREEPGTDSDLNAYDAVYYAGDANAGAKTIAINLPNDEEVQLQKGTRRLQLKNAMRAKFDGIVVPLAAEVIAADQRRHISFDAFFNNVMFHEVAHGLGIKHTITGKGPVREALRDQASALEEAKADVLGLHMVMQLQARGDLGQTDLRDNHVTFLASIFRSIRFGAASAHGRANLATFNFLKEHGAFAHDGASGTWRVDVPRMEAGVNALAGRILRLQGDGDYEEVSRFIKEMSEIGPELRATLDRIGGAGIPVDVVFEQGLSVLGLAPVD
jgi:hypothetical protein